MNELFTWHFLCDTCEHRDEERPVPRCTADGAGYRTAKLTISDRQEPNEVCRFWEKKVES